MVYPNPVQQQSSGIQITPPLHLTGDGELVIIDILGNVLDKSTIDCSNENTYTWDLRNEAGRVVSPGSYIVRVIGTSNDGRKQMYQSVIGVKR